MSATFENAFARIRQLAEEFKAQENYYTSPAYQEQEARRDFIDKFWIALGWDVNHDTQKNPFEQEVKVERKEHGHSQRRADYAFYLRPNFRDVKFYVEAKKPHGDIATADNYFQAVRYGWNSGTPVAVLHDFEQFEIVDCRYMPNIDTALAQNLQKFHYSDYSDSEKLAQIYWLFSREAVASGSLEKFAETLPKKRGKAVQRGLFKGGFQGIDETFLEELDEHREALAKAFKNENPDLDGECLTELTQRTLDRLVFLRFLEDKHIETQNHIAYFGDKGTAWQDFIRESRRLDGIYNGIVYKEHPILDKPSFKSDDEIFSGICERLAHINSPYDFNAVPIHILGSIYERFLGKVIVSTDKRARVEEKPEVRKAGGVYYTPEYIVRYIVENTVGKLIDGKTPAQIAEMRFADIACGSGSFLLGVYDLLLRHHTKYYNDNPDKANIGGKGKKEADCVERDDGLHLSLKKKREILLNNIYGVDIDMQAVEVAQLSLYLKLLQDETPGSAREHQLEFHEALLPSLNRNIVCGNSLIGTDILDGQLFPSNEERKLNPMNFEDAFPHIFKRRSGSELKDAPATPMDFDLPGVPLHGSYGKKKLKKSKLELPKGWNGGFDVVVGNPPYLGGREWKEENGRQYEYFTRRFAVAEYQFDIYALFWEQGIRLLKKSGFIGLITPNTWLNNQSNRRLRKFILDHTSVVSIADYSRVNVFDQAVVLPIVTVLTREKNSTNAVAIYIPVGPSLALARRIPQKLWQDDDLNVFHIALTIEDVALRKRIERNTIPLEAISEVKFGIKLYETGKGTPPQKPNDATDHVFESTRKVNSCYRQYLEGKDINRYEILWRNRWLKYGANLAAPRDPNLFQGDRILVRRIVGERLICTFTDSDFVTSQLLQIVKPFEAAHSKTLLAILNSSLLAYYFKKKYNRQDKTFPEIRIYELAALPIRTLDASDSPQKSTRDRMVQLVDQMLEAKKQLAATQTEKDRTYFENKCASLDRQIDALVYDLYGLTEDEIKIVEGAAQPSPESK